MTQVAIIQSCFIPWKGYFDIINDVNIFIFLDDTQYTTRDWRNRNRIKISNGESKWLVLPVLGGRNQLICEALIDNSQSWRKKHLTTLKHSYGKAPYFELYFPTLQKIFEEPNLYLSELNRKLTCQLSEWLGINTKFVNSVDLGVGGDKDDKLIALVKAVGGLGYVSGPSAKAYIVPEKFADAKISLRFHDYSGYPEYPQISDPFDHYVSVLDLLFMVGPAAGDYIWGYRRMKINN